MLWILTKTFKIFFFTTLITTYSLSLFSIININLELVEKNINSETIKINFNNTLIQQDQIMFYKLYNFNFPSVLTNNLINNENINIIKEPYIPNKQALQTTNTKNKKEVDFNVKIKTENSMPILNIPQYLFISTYQAMYLVITINI